MRTGSFARTHNIQTPVLIMVLGGLGVISHFSEPNPSWLVAGVAGFVWGSIWLHVQRRPFAVLTQDSLVVRERSLSSKAEYDLRKLTDWRSWEYPDTLELFNKDERVAVVSLSGLQYLERGRLLAALSEIIPGEAFGA